MRVALCCPTLERPFPAFLDALEASVPALDAAGLEHSTAFEIGCPYISGARATLLRRAMKWGADVFVFLDHDVSWRPEDLVKLITWPGDVVAGTYRFKIDGEEYMGALEVTPEFRPVVREDGSLEANKVPAGFLKVTRACVDRFMEAYPHLTIDAEDLKSPDLFNHGAHKGTWWGEDYAFCRNWKDIGGEIVLLPDMNIDHHGKDRVWAGNYHEYLLRCPGGSKDPCAFSMQAAA